FEIVSWTISADGMKIDRKENSPIAVGQTVGPASQIGLASLHEGGFLTALRDSSSNLKLFVWGIGPDGKLRRVDDSDFQAGVVTQISLGYQIGGSYVTAVKSSEGILKLMNWRLR